MAMDLTFLKDGLIPGRITLYTLDEVGRRNGLTLVRILRDGTEVSDGIDIQPGEQVTGLRLIFGYGKGSIRGRVILVGDIPAATTVLFRIFVIRKGESQSVATGNGLTTHMNGNFTVDGLHRW